MPRPGELARVADQPKQMLPRRPRRSRQPDGHHFRRKALKRNPQAPHNTPRPKPQPNQLRPLPSAEQTTQPLLPRLQRRRRASLPHLPIAPARTSSRRKKRPSTSNSTSPREYIRSDGALGSGSGHGFVCNTVCYHHPLFVDPLLFPLSPLAALCSVLALPFLCSSHVTYLSVSPTPYTLPTLPTVRMPRETTPRTQAT